MNLLVEDNNKPTKMLWRWVAFISIVLVLLLGTFFAYKAVYVKPVGTSSIPTQTTADGTIFFSGVTKEATTGGVTVTGSGIINVAKSLVSPLAVQVIGGNNTLTMQYNLSNNLLYTTFLGLAEATASSTNQNWSVYRSNTADVQSYDDFTSAIQSNNTLSYPSDDQDYFRMTPVISDKGIILYASLDKQTLTSLTPDLGKISAELWSIYIIDSYGIKRKLTSGISPKWIGDTSFAFLKNDGVYTYDINTGLTALVWKHEGASLTLANGFTVSNDGWNFALAEPTLAQLTVVQVKNWDTKIFSPLVLSDVIVSNPLFSPNNKFLAMVVSSKSSTNQKQSTVTYYDIEQKIFTSKTVPIDEATIGGIYLTGWY